MTFSGLFTSKNSVSGIIAALLIVVLGLIKFSFLQNNILSYDYFGLYLYLPATFIYNDPAVSDLSWLQKINEIYHNTPMFYQLQAVGDYHLIRFFCGMAMLLSPFFFLGHIAAILGGYPVDGFSAPYQLAMTFAAFFYVIVGIVYARKILLHFFTDKVTSWTLIALYLGTNLFFWTTFDAGAPHTILFTLYALLIWYTIRWHEEPKLKYALYIGLTLGFIIVSRPSEIISVFIPLFWNIYSFDSFVKKAKLVWKFRFHFLWLTVATSVIGLPQIWYYYHYTGNLYFSTYTDPQSGLDFSNPRFQWVLFSFRKGWFIYAPLLVFSVIGFPFMIKKQRQIALPVLSYFIINLLIIASFTSLVSYGWRAFIQSYAIMMIPLGFFIQYLTSKKLMIKILFFVVLAFFIYLSVLQSWQIMNGIIDSSRMTKEYYFRIFGRTLISVEDKKLLLINPYLDDETGNKLIDSVRYTKSTLQFYDFNAPIPGLEKFQLVDSQDSLDKCFVLGKQNPYSPGVKIPFRDITESEYFWARISFSFRSDSLIQPSDLLLIATFTYQGKNEKNKNAVYKYRAFKVPFDAEKVNEWQHFSIDYLSPEVTTPQDRLETYVWYRGKNKVLVDDFLVTKFEP